jgi:hypothetical protein
MKFLTFICIASIAHGMICEKHVCFDGFDGIGLNQCLDSGDGLSAPKDMHEYAMLMAAAKDPSKYDALSFVLNMNYAISNNLSFSHLKPADSIALLHKTDWRWNKVSAAMTIFYHQLRARGVSSNLEYLIVVDSDVAILDWSLNISKLINRQPDADIFLFNDVVDGVSSKFIIFRKTHLSLDVLYKWWALRRSIDDPQVAFCATMDHFKITNEAAFAAKVAVAPSRGVFSPRVLHKSNSPSTKHSIVSLEGLSEEVKYEILRNISTYVFCDKDDPPKKHGTALTFSGVDVPAVIFQQRTFLLQQASSCLQSFPVEFSVNSTEYVRKLYDFAEDLLAAVSEYCDSLLPVIDAWVLNEHTQGSMDAIRVLSVEVGADCLHMYDQASEYLMQRITSLLTNSTAAVTHSTETGPIIDSDSDAVNGLKSNADMDITADILAHEDAIVLIRLRFIHAQLRLGHFRVMRDNIPEKKTAGEHVSEPSRILIYHHA